MSEERLFHCIDDAWESGEITDEIRDEAKALLKERLVEAEAWRAVRGTYESNAEEVSSVALGSIEDAFKAQIARLDQLAAPTPTGGE